MNGPLPIPAVPGAEVRKGLSTTSLVLGILSIACFLVLTGIPAIITGHIAYRRARRQPQEYGGAGLALAGLILGYLSIPATVVTAVLLALALPALHQAQRRAQFGGQFGGPPSAPTSSCVNNMKQIGLAARIWSNDHGDKFPADFLTMSNELVFPRVLVCPDDRNKTKAADWAGFDPKQNVTYEFLTPNANEADVMTQPAFRCPIHGNIGLGDGSVQPAGRRR